LYSRPAPVVIARGGNPPHVEDVNVKKDEMVVTNKIFAQAAGRLRRVAKKRTDLVVKNAWLAAANKLDPKKGGAK
jgi:hypothetical protein